MTQPALKENAVEEDGFATLRRRGGRVRWLLHDLSERDFKRGLEIGALDNPCPIPGDISIEYVDYTDTEGLRRQHQEATVRRPNIVDVSHVWQGSGSLADVCGRGDYDFVLASHVIEHVPNVLGWFNGIFGALRPGGVFNLAIPDRRYTFDIRRKESTLGEMVEAYHYAYVRPSIRQMFDHTLDASAVDPGTPWRSDFDLAKIPRYSGDNALPLANAQALKILSEDRYFDSHCWVFTPSTFLDRIEGAIQLGLFPFVFSDFAPTTKGSFEFHVSLRKETHRTGAEAQSWQLATVRHIRKRLDAEQ